ncbi:hypothetical protein T4D_735 [Trichinella pseudospiralis]|uniref:Uncharacterized protein n=1 Tax=Trichinella pseudospiralis TaxID=6337 RepID=A0A0V1FPB1_TRIPS|nr:hypothetical protein T4D_735 [Trichinella pseudospiralis]
MFQYLHPYINSRLLAAGYQPQDELLPYDVNSCPFSSSNIYFHAMQQSTQKYNEAYALCNVRVQAVRTTSTNAVSHCPFQWNQSAKFALVISMPVPRCQG